MTEGAAEDGAFMSCWMQDGLWCVISRFAVICLRRESRESCRESEDASSFQAEGIDTIDWLLVWNESSSGWEGRGGLRDAVTVPAPLKHQHLTTTTTAAPGLSAFHSAGLLLRGGSQHGGNPEKAAKRRVRPQAQSNPRCLRLRLRWVCSSSSITHPGGGGRRGGGLMGSPAPGFTCWIIGRREQLL